MTTPLHRWLEDEGAHRDVVQWARAYGEDWAGAWRECPRGDWLLGIAARRGVDRASLVRAACACARLSLDQLPDEEQRVPRAIEAAERWANGDDAPDDRRGARAEAESAMDSAPDPVVAAAATAALACLDAIESPDVAPTAAAAVVQAAVLDTGDCALMSAMRYAQATSADRVREHVHVSAIAPQA